MAHVLFSTIYNHYPDAWANRICPGVAAIQQFWNALANSPQLDNDDIMSRPDFKDRCIPITVHGDGVPVTGIGKSWGKRKIWQHVCVFFAYVCPSIQTNSASPKASEEREEPDLFKTVEFLQH